MSGVREYAGAGEKVLTVVQKEGETVKPEDTRCRALDENGERCEGDITLDESGTWLVWCKDHQAQEEEAKSDGGPRVVRVEVED